MIDKARKTTSRSRPPAKRAGLKPVQPAVTTTMTFSPILAEPNYRKVAGVIQRRILDRALKNGALLPTELELASQFGVHRSSVREALRELESGGFIGRRRGTKRMVVMRPDAAMIAVRMTHALALHDASVREVWEVLNILEPSAAESAAKWRSAAHLARIEKVVTTPRVQERSAAEAVEQEAEFFRAIAAATNNRVLAMLQEPMIQLLRSTLLLMIDRAPQARSRIATAQKRMLTAIQNRDGEAARSWMLKHIRDFRRGFEVANIDLDLRVEIEQAEE